jgi:alpha-beta hydrolase superfamily lysophospholipase
VTRGRPDAIEHWLSRDEAMVDAYVADPRCGFETNRDEIIAELTAWLDRVAASARGQGAQR